MGFRKMYFRKKLVHEFGGILTSGLRCPFMTDKPLGYSVSPDRNFEAPNRCCTCAKENRPPWSRWPVSWKSEGGCARDGRFLCGWSIYEPKDGGLSQAGVEKSKAARQRSKQVTSSSKRPSPLR